MEHYGPSSSAPIPIQLKGGSRMVNQVPKEYYQLLKEIQAIDFVLVELNLYLDTHPNDYDAIEQFNNYSQKSRGTKK